MYFSDGFCNNLRRIKDGGAYRDIRDIIRKYVLTTDKARPVAFPE